ncbi:MAG: flagella basal body P-ring formation protein FlgA [Myxococcota bacterium]
MRGFFGTLLMVVSLSDPAVGLAQVPSPGANSGADAIVLAEIVPALAGSELGDVPVAPAPALGRSRVVTRRQVLASLEAAGVSPRGLAIPARTTVERASRRLEPSALAELAQPVVARSLAPCAVDELRIAGRADLPPGEVSVRAEMRRPTLTGTSASGFVFVSAGGIERRLAARARLRCPPPVIEAGRRVRAIVTVGRIRATAPAVARQAGRIGDVIRLQNAATGVALLGRIVDADTVELVQ